MEGKIQKDNYHADSLVHGVFSFFLSNEQEENKSLEFQGWFWGVTSIRSSRYTAVWQHYNKGSK